MDKRAYWQSLTDVQKNRLAERLKRSRGYLDRVFLYKRTPGAKLAIEIHEATRGRVTAKELRADMPKGVFRSRPAAS